ncbi:MAG: YbhB/YbcL family Raf kinase inhibitor-like protein [Planctomycetales bacterium]|nr:YbhB/YbcL family Raf kinase inhibitor-like protein [Planctomycetales bacterium]
MNLDVTSAAFENGGLIPPKYTADGQDISPPLGWSGVPEGTQSLALICDDPDAPVGTWVHWLMWNIPPEVTGLNENIPPNAALENGIRQGTTDFNQIGYGGPAPPSGTHRYFFKIYALDSMLNLPPGATKPGLEKAMSGHILAKGELMGKYARKRR